MVLPVDFGPVLPVALEKVRLSLGRGEKDWQFNLLPHSTLTSVPDRRCLLHSGRRLGLAGSKLPEQIGSSQIVPLRDLLRWTLVFAPIPS